jgi:hypothetical protein
MLYAKVEIAYPQQATGNKFNNPVGLKEKLKAEFEQGASF